MSCIHCQYKERSNAYGQTRDKDNGIEFIAGNAAPRHEKVMLQHEDTFKVEQGGVKIVPEKMYLKAEFTGNFKTICPIPAESVR